MLIVILVLSSLYALVMSTLSFYSCIYTYNFEGDGMKIYVLLLDIGTEKLGFS